MRKIVYGAMPALLLILTSCSESPRTAAKKEAEKPLEPATGQSALYKMYQVARSWAPDAQVLQMNNVVLSDLPPAPPGSAAAWEATFVSPARGQSRSYTYSIVDQQPTLHKGVFAGLEQGWSGPHGNTKPFPVIAVKVDTDAAYKTALANGGSEYDKKNPGKPISLTLEKVDKYPDPVWRVIWGESASTSNFSVYIDASTGAFDEKVH
jgi:hypothetical protein